MKGPTKGKRWMAGLVTVVLCGSVGVNLLAYRHAYAMMHFVAGDHRTAEPEKLTAAQKLTVLLRGVSIPRPQTQSSPTDLGPEAQSLRLDCANGLTLGAWYSPGAKPGSLVILFHGYSAEKSATLAEARAFLEMGLSVLMVDFRGSGDSSASYTTVGFLEAEDVAAAVRYAQVHWPHQRLILYGQSMGAAAILRAVQDCGVSPDAIVVEAVFDQMLHTVRHRFAAMGVPAFPGAELLVLWGGIQTGFNGFSHNPVTYARAVRCPILFLHGTADPRAHLEEGRRVFAAVPGNKRFHEFPGLGHESGVVRFASEWKTVVVRFLREVEAGSSL